MQAEEAITRTILAPHPDLAAQWDSIIAPSTVKERLLHHAVLALAVRRRLPFTTTALHGLLLLHGPPGTGKTTMAQGLANELADVLAGPVRLIDVNPHGLMSAEHGQSQQLVSNLLCEVIPGQADDGVPAIVVLDEVESMAVARSEASLSANPVDVHRATDAVLTALDQLTASHPHILTVATSNFTSGLDQALISRADAAIEVPVPTVDAHLAILIGTIDGYAEAFPRLRHLREDPELRKVAARLEGRDGRIARKLVANAAARRLDTAVDPGRLTATDLLDAALVDHNTIAGVHDAAA
jgi:AAA+ superfamily predicted ATPase